MADISSVVAASARIKVAAAAFERESRAKTERAKMERAKTERAKTDWYMDDFTEDEESDMEMDDEESDTEMDDKVSRNTIKKSYIQEHTLTLQLPIDPAQNSDDDPSSSESISDSRSSSTTEDVAIPQSPVNQDLTVLASPDDHTRLLFITELVQNVFVNLPFRDRVMCTGVCKTWRQLLRHEGPTAYQMFLKPILKVPFVPINLPANLPDWKLEKLRGEWHRSLNTSDSCKKERCVTLRPHRKVEKLFVHPVFYKLSLNAETCLRINGHSASFLFLTPESISPFLELHEHSPQEASWRKMLLTNPPVKRFAAYSELPGDVVGNENGLELGQVATHITDILRREDYRDKDWQDENRSEMVKRMLAEERKKSEE
jgi:hypothetical protein